MRAALLLTLLFGCHSALEVPDPVDTEALDTESATDTEVVTDTEPGSPTEFDISDLDPHLWLSSADLEHVGDNPLPAWTAHRNSRYSSAAPTTGQTPGVGVDNRRLPWVQFYGVDDQLVLDDNPLFSVPDPVGGWELQLFVIVRYEGLQYAHVVGSGASTVGGRIENEGVGLFLNNGVIEVKATAAGVGLRLISPEVTHDERLHLVTVSMGADGGVLRLDGAEVAASSEVPVGAAELSTSTLGSSDGAGLGVAINPYIGHIGEVIAWPSRLSDAEVALVETWLLDKFSITP